MVGPIKFTRSLPANERARAKVPANTTNLRIFHLKMDMAS